jgi:hypothetical protein
MKENLREWDNQVLMKENLREWDDQVLRSCLYPHDIEAVKQIRPAQMGEDDFVAWFYEKSGLFSIKSAYKLTLRVEQGAKWDVASSSGVTDGKPIYNDIWKAEVPLMIHVFTWKLSQNGLATQDNRKNRGLTRSDIYMQHLW